MKVSLGNFLTNLSGLALAFWSFIPPEFVFEKTSMPQFQSTHLHPVYLPLYMPMFNKYTVSMVLAFLVYTGAAGITTCDNLLQ